MKSLRYVALLGLLLLPLTYSPAQVRVGIGIGIGSGYGPRYVAGPPACPYGYYADYPYGCAPYGYYGSSYFVDGVFIGAGPWFHGYGRPVYNSRYYDRGYYSRGYYGGRDYDRDDHRFYGGDRDHDGRAFRGRTTVGRRDFDDRHSDNRGNGRR